MRKIVLLLFLLISNVRAEVKIDSKNHMQNKEPGRCAWAALETLGRTHGWKGLEGLVEQNDRTASRHDMIGWLDDVGVKYRVLWAEEGEYLYYLMYQRAEGYNQTTYAIKKTKPDADKMLNSLKIEGFWWVEKHLHWKASFLYKSMTLVIVV